MLANDLKKGMNVILKNGCYATIMDNRKGNIRLALVMGWAGEETGSIYVSEIDVVERPEGGWERVELSESQKKNAEMRKMFGF